LRRETIHRQTAGGSGDGTLSFEASCYSIRLASAYLGHTKSAQMFSNPIE